MAVKFNERMLPNIRQAAMRGVVGWIGLVEERAVDLIMSPPKTGRIYRRRGVEHRASAPGEAPANDQGTLVNTRRISLFEEQLRARLTFSAAHALPLEFGTLRMEPRPFARRALMERNAEGIELVKMEIRAIGR